jgi:hypothetical protein
MDTQSIGTSFYNAFMIVGAILILGLGIWLGIKYGTPAPAPKPVAQPPPTPPDVPQPIEPDRHPAVHPSPPLKPSPAKPFTPHLKLKQALYNPASREIKVEYVVDADSPLSVTRTYSINFLVEVNGSPITSISENEPLHQDDVGFVKETVLETIPSGTKSSQLAVKAQLNYYASDGTTGVSGTPQTIRVS